MSDTIITSTKAPKVTSTQKKYIWAKPTGDGFKYFTYSNGEWLPLAYADKDCCAALTSEEILGILKVDGDQLPSDGTGVPLEGSELQSTLN